MLKFNSTKQIDTARVIMRRFDRRIRCHESRFSTVLSSATFPVRNFDPKQFRSVIRFHVGRTNSNVLNESLRIKSSYLFGGCKRCLSASSGGKRSSGTEGGKNLSSASSFVSTLSDTFTENTQDNTNDSKHVKDNRSPTSMYELPTLIKAMSGLYKRRREIDKNRDQDMLYLAAKEILRRLRIGIMKGVISVNRNLHSISNLVSDALVLFGDTKSLPQYSDQKMIDATKMLNYMKNSLRLDLTPNHFAGIIRIACVEEKWETASKLFLTQIDDFAGMVPMNAAGEALEFGMYAVARTKCDDPSISPDRLAEEVLDIARSLAIVSPMDLDGYMIAAVKALGQIGEWHATLEFFRSNESMGEPLVAAVMNACLASGRYNEALAVYDRYDCFDYESTGVFEQNVQDVRNAAFCAYGQAPNGKSVDAIQLFQRLKPSDHSFSLNAVVGLLSACSRDSEWSNCINVLEHFLAHNTVNESFNIFDVKILSVVMEALNSARKYNDALLYAYVFNNEFMASKTIDDNDVVPYFSPLLPQKEKVLNVSGLLHGEDESLLEVSLLRYFDKVPDHFLVNMFTTLIGIGAFARVINIYQLLGSQYDLDEYDELNGLLTTYKLVPSYDHFDRTKTLLEESLETFHHQLGIFHVNKYTRGTIGAMLQHINKSLDYDDVGLLIASRLTGLELVKNPLMIQPKTLDNDSLVAYMKILQRSGKADQAIDVYFSKVDSDPMLTVYEWKESLYLCFEILAELNRPDTILNIIRQMNIATIESYDLDIASDVLLKTKLFKGVRELVDIGANYAIISDHLLINAIIAISNEQLNEKTDQYSSVIKMYEDSEGIELGTWAVSNELLIARRCPGKSWRFIFGWSSKQSKQNQFQLAYEAFVNLSTRDNLTRDEIFNVIGALVDVAGHKQRFENCRGRPKPNFVEGTKEFRTQSRQRRIGIEIIEEVLDYIKNNKLTLDDDLILKVIMALRSLKGERKALPIIREFDISRNELLTDTYRKIILQSIAISENMGEYKLRSDLISALSKFGIHFEDE